MKSIISHLSKRSISVTTFICFTLFYCLSIVHSETNKYHEILHFEPNETGGIFYSLSYSPNGKTIAVGTYDKHAIEIRDAKTGKEINTLFDEAEQGKAPISVPVWSPDGKFIAELSIEYGSSPNNNSGVIYVWEVASGRRTQIANIKNAKNKYAGKSGDIGDRYFAWRPNTTDLLIINNARELRLLDSSTGHIYWTVYPYANQPSDFANSASEYPCRPQWNPNGTRFACIGDGIQGIFDGTTGSHLFDLENETALDSHPQWTQDGKYIANVDVGESGNSYAIKVWDANTGKKADFAVKNGFPFSISSNNTIAYIDAATTELTFSSIYTGVVSDIVKIDFNPSSPTLAWSPDGTSLAVIDRNSIAHIYSDQK